MHTCGSTSGRGMKRTVMKTATWGTNGRTSTCAHDTALRGASLMPAGEFFPGSNLPIYLIANMTSHFTGRSESGFRLHPDHPPHSPHEGIGSRHS